MIIYGVILLEVFVSTEDEEDHEETAMIFYILIQIWLRLMRLHEVLIPIEPIDFFPVF